MRSFFYSLLFLVNVLKGAEKPDHILIDPQARDLIKIKDESLQRKYGTQMALYMRALRPTVAIDGKGQLRIRPKTGKRKTLSVQFRSFVFGAAVVNQYGIPSGTLTIKQQIGQETQYEWVESGKNAQRLDAAQAGVPFAGSDFWMFDLGLEMLRWPNQKVVERELRRGELCSVLVSRPRMVAQGGYSKVISWVDEDSMGIVRAELYDSKSKLLKIFEPKSFKKINGQWHLKEMEMRNEQTNTRTSILFDLEEVIKPSPK